MICLCELHRRSVDHLHILDYERPYYLLSILQKWRGGGKRQRSGSHGLRDYRMDIQRDVCFVETQCSIEENGPLAIMGGGQNPQEEFVRKHHGL